MIYLLILPFAFAGVGTLDYSLHGDNWKDICAIGKRQSPIDINTERIVIENIMQLQTSTLGVLHDVPIHFAHHKI